MGQLGNPAWKKGVSGNPGGKPKATVELMKLAREHTLEAWKTIIEIMKDAKAHRIVRLRAAELVLDRGHGKAPLSINLRREDGVLTRLSDAELDAIARGIDGEAASSSDSAEAQSDPRKLN
jgi:hypothetical protein